jgi:hypothetical protein
MSRQDWQDFDWKREYPALPVEDRREADKVYAFCLSGQGHQAIHVEPADPSVGIFGVSAWCDDCCFDLSDEEVVNPQPEKEI